MGKPKYFVRMVLLAAWTACAVEGASFTREVRQATLDYDLKDREAAGIEKMAGYLARRLESTARLASREIGQLAQVADCVRFLELAREVRPDPETARWLLDRKSVV